MPRASRSAARRCRSGRTGPASARPPPGAPSTRPELADERRRVERLEAEPRGDLLARGQRALPEQLPQEVAGLAAAPPVLADLAHQVRPELRRSDPRAEIVGRVE